MIDHSQTDMPHPYLEGLTVMGLLCGLFGLLTAGTYALALAGWVTPGWVMLPAVMLGMWALMLAAIWGWGLFQRARMNDFLHSNRPLVRWQYTPDEWAATRQEQDNAQQAQTTLTLGCLTALFALIGLLTGGMVGADTGLAEALLGSGAGLLIGAVVGAVLGGTVAGGNALAYRMLRFRDQPICVALGATEILYGRDYFRAGGSRFIKQVQLQESPPLLHIELHNPKPRGDSAETWTIPVPQRMVAAAATVLPQIPTRTHPR